MLHQLQEDWFRQLKWIPILPTNYGQHFPVEYLFWFKERGFPKGRLGELMAVVCEVKGVGMDSLFDTIRQARGGRVSFHPKRKKVHRFKDEDGGEG